MSKLKKIVQVIFLIAVMIIGIFLIGNEESLAKRVTSSVKGEIFENDKGSLNWDGIPSDLFSDYGITLWCIEKENGISAYLTADEAYYDAYYGNTSSATYDGIYKYYRRSSSLGLIRSHTSYYSEFTSYLNDHKYKNTRNVSSYDYDDQSVIDALESELPGLGTDVLKSIEYTQTATLSSSSNQDVLYVLTAGVDGYDEVEQQYALWELDINIGTKLSTNSDSGLGNLAKQYKTFYNTIHPNGTDVYPDLVEAESTTTNGSVTKDTTTINGTSYNTYVYDDTTVEVDTSNNCYVLRAI